MKNIASKTDSQRAEIQAAFLTILPIIESIARMRLRYIADQDARADAVAEVVAICWKWFHRLWGKGKDARRFPVALTHLAVRSVKSGRRLDRTESARDAMSLAARLRHGFSLRQLQDRGPYDDPQWQEAIADNTRSPVPEQAAFRVDFPTWLKQLGRRNRRIAETMLRGESTFKLARRFRLSPGRISQLRQEFHDAWRHFHGEEKRHHEQPAVAA